MTLITCIDSTGKTYTFEESVYVERPSVYGMLLLDDELLLVKDTWGKKWGLPGGGIDSGESEEEALVREFQEETKIEIQVKEKLFSDVSYFFGTGEKYPWKSLRSFYTVHATGGILQTAGNNDDVIQANYFSFEEIKNIELQPNTAHLIEKLNQMR